MGQNNNDNDVSDDSNEKKNSNIFTNPATTPHFAGLAFSAFGFFAILGPLIIHIVTDDDFVRENAAKSLTWQLFLTLYTLLILLIFRYFIRYLNLSDVIIVILGLITPGVLVLLNGVLCIYAAVKANEGEAWKYPGTIDLL